MGLLDMSGKICPHVFELCTCVKPSGEMIHYVSFVLKEAGERLRQESARKVYRQNAQKAREAKRVCKLYIFPTVGGAVLRGLKYQGCPTSSIHFMLYMNNQVHRALKERKIERKREGKKKIKYSFHSLEKYSGLIQLQQFRKII